MNEEFEVKKSPLCQSVTRDGKTVQIEIFADGEGGWILEVVDPYNNSTVWEDAFETDALALEEAMETINQEGISVLIGPDSDNS